MGYGSSKDSPGTKAALRTVVLTSADAHFRERLRQQLMAMRWTVREASGGAQALVELQRQPAEAMVLDSTLPDLEVGEFAQQMRSRHPTMDLLQVDMGGEETAARSPRHNELLHALRRAQEEVRVPARSLPDTVAWATAPAVVPQSFAAGRLAPADERALISREVTDFLRARAQGVADNDVLSLEVGLPVPAIAAAALPEKPHISSRAAIQPLPEMVGDSPGMVELARMVRLVAPRSTPVLIQGETGTGKELVAKAVHILSKRASKS